MNFILALAIFTGQLIKIPLTQNSGITLLDLTIFLLSIWGIFEIKFKFKKPPLSFLFFLLFSITGTISLFLSLLKLSPQEVFISFSYNLRFLFYLLFGWILYSGGLGQIQKNFFKILLTSGSLLSIAGLIQLIFIPNLAFLSNEGWDPHYFRTVSTFLDPNFLGGFLSLVLLLLLSDFEKMKTNKKLPGIFIVCFLALLTTFSRSATVCFLSAALILSLLKKSMRLFLLTLLLTLCFGIAFLAYHQFISEPRNIDRNQSASYRLNTYQEGLQIFEHSLLIGVGFNSYRFALEKYKLAPVSVINSHGGTTNDSSLLYVLATTGVLGFIFYFAGLLSLIASHLSQKRRSYTFYFIAGLIGLIFQSFFINILFYPWILLWIFCIFPTVISND